MIIIDLSEIGTTEKLKRFLHNAGRDDLVEKFERTGMLRAEEVEGIVQDILGIPEYNDDNFRGWLYREEE